MSADHKTLSWMRAGGYLPKFMRDFHAQKDVFKTIADHYAKRDETRPHEAVDWVRAHIYTIDLFLWWMALHGYTLQKSRKRVPFDSIADDVNERREKDAAHFAELLGYKRKEVAA